MSIVEDLSSEQSATRWGKPILIAGGLVWIGRAALETIFRHDYWNPQTAVDYTAVAGFSLALFLLSLGLWAIHRGRNPQTGLRKRLWFAGIGLACSGAPLAGISAIGAGDLPRWTSWLFFARALGLGTIDSGGDSFPVFADFIGCSAKVVIIG